jgi:hypothetical protein
MHMIPPKRKEQWKEKLLQVHPFHRLRFRLQIFHEQCRITQVKTALVVNGKTNMGLCFMVQALLDAQGELSGAAASILAQHVRF